MASSEPGRSSGHGEETTQPPEGMYWVQMQALWALRPIVDLDSNRVRANASQPTERAVGSTLAQQRVSLSDADRQWLSQSAGAACSAAALTEASAPPEGEGNSRLERLPRTQGVIEFRHQHCSPSFAAAVAHDTTPRVQPQPLTSPPPLPLPAPPPQQVPEQQHQVWPDWLLQWGRRVEDEEGSGHAPGPSAPPSAPPSPPKTPQRSMVKKCPSPQHAKVCTHPQLPMPEEKQWPQAADSTALSTIQAVETRPRVVLPPQPVGCAAAEGTAGACGPRSSYGALAH